MGPPWHCFRWVRGPAEPTEPAWHAPGFMDVYDTAIQTLLLSFCLDEDKFKNGLYKKKLDAQGNADPRMFCEVNSKSGLMQMVNGGSKKEGKAEAKKQQVIQRPRPAPATARQCSSHRNSPPTRAPKSRRHRPTKLLPRRRH